MATEKILIFDEAGNAKRMKVRIARFLDNEPVTASDKTNIRTTLDVDDSLSGTFTTPLSVTSASDSSFTGGGKVGIGTSSPNVLLHCDSGGNTAANLKLEANRTGADAAVGQIAADWDGTTVAKIALKSGSDTTNKDDGEIVFETATAGSTAERVRIDSSGNTGFGQPSPSTKVDVNGVLTIDTDYAPSSAVGGLALGDYQGGGYKWVQSMNSQPLALNPLGNNVGIGSTPSINLGGGLSVDGGSGYVNLNLVKGSAGTGHAVDFSDENGALQFRVGTNFSSGGNNLIFARGTGSTIAWKIDSATGNLVANSTGIDFGSGATLSDYEEGTFTPTIYYGNSSGLTISYTTQTGRYVRVGDLVSVHAFVVWTVTGTPANDNIGVGGLPHQPVAARQFLQCVDSQGQSAAAECASAIPAAISISGSFVSNLADDIGAGTHTMMVSGTYQTS